MQKIIGLDIGSYSIKAVEILNHFKTFEISNYYESILPPLAEGQDKDELVQKKLQELFEKNKIKADRVITALPGQYCSSRILSFNFSDQRKIAAGVTSEIEDTVPFNLNEMVLDHQILGKSQNKTLALAVLTRKKFLANFLEHLQCINIDPKVVDIDSLALYNLTSYLPLNANKPSALIDIGHEKTSICIVQNGLLKMFRSINIGGRFITEFLARELEISYLEAQELKHKVSIAIPRDGSGLLSSLKQEDKVIAEKITTACDSLIREIGRTLFSFKDWEKEPVETIYLSGGTSLIKNLDRHLDSSLKIKTTATNFSSQEFHLDHSLESKKPQLIQGFAVALRATTSSKVGSKINLRKGAFAYIHDYGPIFQLASRLMRYSSILFLVLTASYLLRYYTYTEQNKQIIAAYEKVYLTSFPKERARFQNFEGNLADIHKPAKNRLRRDINSSQTALASFKKLNHKSPPLLALLELSEQMPKNLNISITSLIFTNNNQMRFRIEADSYGSLEKFKNKLESLKNFSDIKELKTDLKTGSTMHLGEYLASYNPSEDK